MNTPARSVFDPRLRLAAAIVASVLISQLQAVPLLAVLAAAGAGALALAAIRGLAPPRALLRRALAINAFVALLWLTLPWQLAADGPRLSEAGIALALQLSLRTNAIALLCLALLAGLDAFAIARAAAGLGLPPRLARLLLLTVRYLGVLDDTRQRLDRAMRARGFRPRADRRTLAVIGQQIALLLVHAMLRAERAELALRARGYRADAAPAQRQGRPRLWAAGTAAACVLALLPGVLR